MAVLETAVLEILIRKWAARFVLRSYVALMMDNLRLPAPLLSASLKASGIGESGCEGGVASRFSSGALTIKISKVALALSGAVLLTACAQNSPQRIASAAVGLDKGNRYGVPASPRVVEEGQEVPKGGGRYQVGKPYQIAGTTYYPSERHTAEVGVASWYGRDFHGRKTANGEVFDRNSYSAAHRTMPLPSYARVTNTKNGYSMVVRVNDRGPYHGHRLIDVSQKVAEALDFKGDGVGRVKVEYLRPAGLYGSDDTKLLATLRTDGSAAQIEGAPAQSPVMTAERDSESHEEAVSTTPRRAAASERSRIGKGEPQTRGSTTVAFAEDPASRPKALTHSPRHTEDASEDGVQKSDHKNALGSSTAMAFAGQGDLNSLEKASPLPPARPASLKPTPVDDDTE